VPDRELKTVQSPQTNQKGDGSATLPVVEEVGESGSQGGRSPRSSVGVGGESQQDVSDEKGEGLERKLLPAPANGGVERSRAVA
jgi:hypothetical protein